MTSVRIVHPAPDGNGTSILVNGVELRDHVLAGGITVQHRKMPYPPLVTLTIAADELEVFGDVADVIMKRDRAVPVHGQNDPAEHIIGVSHCAGCGKTDAECDAAGRPCCVLCGDREHNGAHHETD